MRSSPECSASCYPRPREPRRLHDRDSGYAHNYLPRTACEDGLRKYSSQRRFAVLPLQKLQVALREKIAAIQHDLEVLSQGLELELGSLIAQYMAGTTRYAERIGKALLEGAYDRLTCREMHELQEAIGKPAPHYDQVQGHCARIREQFQRHMATIFKAPSNPMEALNESTIVRREASEELLDEVILSSLRIEDVKFARSELRPEARNFLKKPPVDNDDDDDIEEVVEMEQSYYDQIDS